MKSTHLNLSLGLHLPVATSRTRREIPSVKYQRKQKFPEISIKIQDGGEHRKDRRDRSTAADKK